MTQLEQEQQRLAEAIQRVKTQESVKHVLFSGGEQTALCLHCGASFSFKPPSEVSPTVAQVRAARQLMEKLFEFRPTHRACPTPVRPTGQPTRSLDEALRLAWRERATGVVWLVANIEPPKKPPFRVTCVLKRPNQPDAPTQQVDLLHLEDDYAPETEEQVQAHIFLGMDGGSLICGHCQGDEKVRALTKDAFLQWMEAFTQRHVWCPRTPQSEKPTPMRETRYRRRSDSMVWTHVATSAQFYDAPFRIQATHRLKPADGSGRSEIVVTDRELGELFEQVKKPQGAPRDDGTEPSLAPISLAITTATPSATPSRT